MESSSDETDYNQPTGVMSEAKSGDSSPSSSQDSQDEDFFVPPETQPSYSSNFIQQPPTDYNSHKRRYSSQSTQSTSSSTTQDEETAEPPTKMGKLGNYSDKAMSFMMKMGYDPQKGLGKSGQGRLEPVEASTQAGRRGFGLKLEGIDSAAEKWTADMEEIKIPESIEWLKNEDTDLYEITMQDLSEWVVVGHKKMTIDDESKFCDPEILKNVLSSKSVFDDLTEDLMRSARNRCNPFEKIKNSIFLNRAAVKMANIDSMCGFMFTDPVDKNGQSLIKENDLLYFADVCAGPGGFSEYVLFKKQWEAKGFGFTLRANNDFKLDKFHAGPPETFDPYYGIRGDGDIFAPENITSFMEYVLRQTATGVHFVMADGGFDVSGKENIQEILSKRLYLCQCIVALSILRPKGHFVCKLFDLFTPFSVGLIYLMYKCFEEISICKPNTSRPANSERYMVCKWKKDNTDTIRRHLFQINQEMDNSRDSDIDTVELVRYDILRKDKNFIKYIVDSNNTFGTNQIVGLIKVAAFSKDTKLEEGRQVEIREKCLELWRIPNRMRREPEKVSNEVLLAELLGAWHDGSKWLESPAKELGNMVDLKKRVLSIYNWYFMPICREESEKNIRTMFLCKGGADVYILTPSGTWRPLREIYVEITPKSLFYGEIVTELIGESRSQSRCHALHIIDAIILGGKDIRRYPLSERVKMCDKFARALNKPYVVRTDETQPVPIRAKKLYSLIDFKAFFDQMKLYKLKDGRDRLGLRIRTDEERQERFFVPGGLLFFNGIYSKFTCHLSKSTKKHFYVDMETQQSFYLEDMDPHNAVYASFRFSYMCRMMWKWVNVHQVDEIVNEAEKVPNILYRSDIFQFLQSVLVS